MILIPQQMSELFVTNERSCCAFQVATVLAYLFSLFVPPLNILIQLALNYRILKIEIQIGNDGMQLRKRTLAVISVGKPALMCCSLWTKVAEVAKCERLTQRNLHSF